MDARFDAAKEIWGSFSALFSESHGIAGKLKYSPSDGLLLELANDPVNDRSADNKLNEFPSLYGRLVDGSRVTLLNCHVRKKIYGMSGSCFPVEISVQKIIFGDHISDVKGATFSQGAVELTSLSSWIGLPVISGNIDSSGIHYRLPDDVKILLPDHNVKIILKTYILHSSSIQSYTLRWISEVLIVPDQPQPLIWYEELCQRIQHLFSLFIGELVFVRKFSLEKVTNQKEKPIRHYHDLCLLYRQPGNVNFGDIHPGSVMIPYGKIKDDFSNIIQKWFAMPKQAVLATMVFFVGQALESSVLNLEYLRITQVAESYHRALGIGLYMKQDEYNEIYHEMIKHIPDSIARNHRQSLESKLKYGNEYSLRKRILELFKRLPADLQLGILGGEKSIDLNEFSSKAKNTRNYFTHYSVELENDIFTNDQAFVAGRKFRVLLMANLLLDLGLPGARLLEILKSNDDIRFWMDHTL